MPGPAAIRWGDKMEKRSFAGRVLVPVAIVFATMAASWIIYNLAWRLDSRSLHQFLATVCGTLLFVSVTFGAFLVYPMAYFRGASTLERVAACLVNPFIWMTKENIRLTISYSFGESLYYYLNPLSIWLLLGVITQMGLAHMFCRWWAAKKNEDRKAFSPGALATFALGLFLTITLFAWGQGENVYVIFLSGYREIFGSGL